MKVSDSIQKNRSQREFKREMRRLKDKQEIEIQKLQAEHMKRKANISINNQAELQNLRSDHDFKIRKQVQRNEEALKGIEKSLQDVKDRTEKEKTRIIKDLSQEKELRSAQHKLQIDKRRLDAQLKLDDITHEANIEAQKIQRENLAQKQSVTNDNRREISRIKSSSLRKKDYTKEKYEKETLAEENKYIKAIQKLRKRNKETLVSEDKNYQKKLQQNTRLHNKSVERLTKDQQAKRTNLKREFEKHFHKDFHKNNNTMKTLVGRKEKIYQILKEDIRAKAQREFTLKEDPFYHYIDLQPEVVNDAENKEYILKFKVPEYEAKNVKLVAQDRELRLSYDRNYKHVQNDEDGSQDTINKVESYITKIPVEDIVNSKKVSKSYEQGQLIYRIGKA